MTHETETTSSGHLFALMYSSHAVEAMNSASLDTILEQARRKNARIDITGILLYRQGRFFQYLEGEEAAVRGVYDEIREDPRHTDLRVLLESPVGSRRFSEWTMGSEPLRETAAATPAGFRSTFDDLEDTQYPATVLRAVTELTYWYRARARTQPRASRL